MSLRNLTKLRSDKVKVLCTDTDKIVDAKLIDRTARFIKVEIPGGLELTLQKHAKKAGLFVGSSNGLEFQCQLADNNY